MNLEINNLVGAELADISLQVAEILKHNKALRHLKMHTFHIPEDIGAVRYIVNALHENASLQLLEMCASIKNVTDTKSSDRIMNKLGVTFDTRISWIYMTCII